MLDHGAMDKLLLKDQLMEIMPRAKAFRGFHEVHLFSFIKLN
jgi:hypothetical protein